MALITDPQRLKDLFGSSPTMIGKLKIDVLQQEIPDFGWDIPTHRVDVGTDVADSRYQRPVGVVLECVLLDPEYSLTNVVSTAIGGGSFDNDDWRTKRDKLMSAIGKNELITAVTPSGFDYSSMMVDAIQPDLRPQTSGGFFFRISLRKVEIVSSELLGIDVSLLPDELKRAKNAQAETKKKGNKNQGKRKALTADERKKSILKKGKDAIERAIAEAP